MIRNNQRGGASLVSVSLLSLVILVITLAMSRMMVGELRNAIDLESNAGAFYEAESGAEEAIYALKSAIGSGGFNALTDANQGCDYQPAGTDLVLSNFGQPGWNVPNRTAITCRAIKVRGNVDEAFLKERNVAHYDLSKVGFTNMDIAWDFNYPDSGGNFGGYGGNAPPVLEVTRIAYKDAAPYGAPTEIQTSSINIKSLLLRPDQPTATLDASCYVSGIINFENCQSPNGGAVTVRCTTGASRRCKATINHFIPSPVGAERPDTNRTVLRIRPYFNNMAYRLILSDSTGKAVTIVLPRAKIDVTARVGDSLRRIQEQIDLVSRPFQMDVLFGDDNICKKFLIADDSLEKKIAANTWPANECGPINFQ